MLLKIAAIGVGIYATVILSIGLILMRTGVLEVSIQDKVKNRQIYVPVPMLMVNGAIQLLPEAKLNAARAKLDHQKVGWLMAAGKVLAECEDADFVDVKTATDHLVLAKKGANFLLDADTPDHRVHVSIPIHATREAIENLISK